MKPKLFSLELELEMALRVLRRGVLDSPLLPLST